MDKAWNYGFRKFFPKVETIGYQGFTNYPEYMNTIPTACENKHKVIPEKIFVLSKNYKYLRKEFCKQLKIFLHIAALYISSFLFSESVFFP